MTSVSGDELLARAPELPSVSPEEWRAVVRQAGAVDIAAAPDPNDLQAPPIGS